MSDENFLPTLPVILIVDDDESIRFTLGFLVEELGYTALLAANGRTGLELLYQRRPALVITDLMMPVLSGADLIAAIHSHADQAIRATPIILATAAGSPSTRSLGADAIVTKPFDIAELDALVHRLLGT